MSEEITKEIQEKIMSLVYSKEGEKFISLGNSRLNFKTEYKFIGFTKKTVKLAYENGGKYYPLQGRVARGKLYTEGWNYIENLFKE